MNMQLTYMAPLLLLFFSLLLFLCLFFMLNYLFMIKIKRKKEKKKKEIDLVIVRYYSIILTRHYDLVAHKRMNQYLIIMGYKIIVTT